MTKQLKALFLICETPLHAGSGSSLGLVDLPIQRERHTGLPKIEGSTIKGCIRSALSQSALEDNAFKEKVNIVFGPESKDEYYAGALGFTDARLLLFPVKSARGVFAWITCPAVLHRLKADHATCGVSIDLTVPNFDEASVPPGSLLFADKLQQNKTDKHAKLGCRKIILEEYTIKVDKPDNKEAEQWAGWFAERLFAEDAYWQEKFKQSFVILRDEDFRDFAEMSTEVITRVKIDSEKGTVEGKALFTEEYLPAESVLYTIGVVDRTFAPVKLVTQIFNEDSSSNKPVGPEMVWKFFSDNMPKKLFMGGNTTLGKGLIRLVLPKEV